MVNNITGSSFLSLIAYADTLNPKRLNFVPIDPGDSIIEIIRVGLEHDFPFEFIDLSVKDYAPANISLPDDYSFNDLGLPLFYEKISEHIKKERKEKKASIETA